MLNCIYLYVQYINNKTARISPIKVFVFYIPTTSIRTIFSTNMTLLWHYYFCGNNLIKWPILDMY